MTAPPDPPRTAEGRVRPRILVGLVLLGLVGAVLSLALLEGGLRAANASPHGYLLVDEDTCYCAWGGDTRDVTKSRDDALTHDASTDAHGFRVEPGEARPASRCRVLAVGDSYTHGMYVSASEAYPAVVEGMLRARGLDVQVDNGGMPGDTIAEARVGVLGRWRELAPDVVLVGQTANDVEDLLLMKRRDCRLGGEVPTAFAPAVSRRVAGLRIVGLGEEVAARIQTLSPKMNAVRNRAGAIDPPPSLDECAAVRVTHRELARDLVRAVRARGGQVAFVLHEDTWCAKDVDRPAQEALRRALLDDGALVIDARPVMQEADSTLRPLDGHPSPLGHRRYAEHIVPALEGAGWLDRCR